MSDLVSIRSIFSRLECLYKFECLYKLKKHRRENRLGQG